MADGDTPIRLDTLVKPKVEADPKGYRRKSKHKVDPVAKAEEQDEG